MADREPPDDERGVDIDALARMLSREANRMRDSMVSRPAQPPCQPASSCRSNAVEVPAAICCGATGSQQQVPCMRMRPGVRRRQFGIGAIGPDPSS